MSGLSVFAVKVCPMTVFVPPGSLVRQCTVGDSNVIVFVLSRERSALVVAQRITWTKKRPDTKTSLTLTTLSGQVSPRTYTFSKAYF